MAEDHLGIRYMCGLLEEFRCEITDAFTAAHIERGYECNGVLWVQVS